MFIGIISLFYIEKNFTEKRLFTLIKRDELDICDKRIHH